MISGFVKRRPDGSPAWLYSRKTRARSARVRDARWGDFLRIEGAGDDGWAQIRWGKARYFIPVEDIATQRPLEVIFLDVGQGDGCIVVSPETGADAATPEAERERILVIDAGISDNMLNFLKWRFGKLKTAFRFHAAVVTHPDADHYRGFQKIFSHKNVAFDRVYHNGIMERTGDDTLGPSDPTGRYLTDIAVTDADIRALYGNAAVRGGKWYPRLMHTAMTGGRVGAIEMLSAGHGEMHGGRCWMPGFSPQSDRSMVIEVVGPVPEPDDGGRTRLRWFGDFIGSQAKNEGKTKNGHSVLLRLTMGAFNLLFGGDLNSPAEDYLLRHYGGIGAGAPLADAVAQARTRLSADMMKSCHHGSNDVTDEFLEAVHPFAFVVSSGDEESHAHPRPDLLGRLGKKGRTDAPLILCTEILRSTREKGRAEDFNRLRKLNETIDGDDASDDEKEKARAERKELIAFIRKRNVGVYGSVTVRTDGGFMEISFMLEKPRGKQRWQRYGFAQGPHGNWVSAGDDGGH
jgi:beta-lactamase superfamily II metal-dependent hydrolase